MTEVEMMKNLWPCWKTSVSIDQIASCRFSFKTGYHMYVKSDANFSVLIWDA